ncbi:hypothetical protein BT96DRAFT_808440 [Gymnopus androsaceus JB14]|uniref:Uncharacterized protein n=1 Tax=Gymnopus androsaceus JB14 TaxID=1447944 RepID=A0A6A4IGK0_9AGAR|nr:hypothetical protein BT96DRAFT_808440 [Gymnopus androsaceus JB14]
MPSSHASIDELSSESSYDSDEEYYLAQKEWEESIQQLEQIVSIVLLPYLGKWLGRRWSYWAYARYLRLGLGKAFIFEK